MKKKIEELEKRIEVLERKSWNITLNYPQIQQPYIDQPRCQRCGATYSGIHMC